MVENGHCNRSLSEQRNTPLTFKRHLTNLTKYFQAVLFAALPRGDTKLLSRNAKPVYTFKWNQEQRPAVWKTCCQLTVCRQTQLYTRTFSQILNQTIRNMITLNIATQKGNSAEFEMHFHLQFLPHLNIVFNIYHFH